ncbi:MAG: radical SAM protein, partial [Verrucomicrobiota bacterium]|nr:radical SAM protein [Verrucomicrobiota bacterium]
TIGSRIMALEDLHRAGIRTFVMVAPVLPGAEGLAELLRGKIDSLLCDRMNYHYADRLYREHGLEYARTDEYYRKVAEALGGRWVGRG